MSYLGINLTTLKKYAVIYNIRGQLINIYIFNTYSHLNNDKSSLG